MSAMLTGRVVRCCVILSNGAGAMPTAYLKLVAQQPDTGAEFEFLKALGRGYAAAFTGDQMRARLQPGTLVQAIGESVAIRNHPTTGEARLVLVGVEHLRGGDTQNRHQPAPAVHAVLQRIQARRAALAAYIHPAQA